MVTDCESHIRYTNSFKYWKSLGLQIIVELSSLQPKTQLGKHSHLVIRSQHGLSLAELFLIITGDRKVLWASSNNFSFIIYTEDYIIRTFKFEMYIIYALKRIEKTNISAKVVWGEFV